MEQEDLNRSVPELPAQAAERTLSENKPRKGMKIFRMVYYIVIGLLLIAMFALSCVDMKGTKTSTTFDASKAVGYVEDMTKRNSSSIYDTTAHAERVKYITDKLDDFGLNEVEQKSATSDRYTTKEDKVTVPSYTKLAMTMKAADRYAWEKEYTGKEPETALTDIALTDIVAYFPANCSAEDRSGDVILFMAHYDSVMMGPGANDDLSSVSAMLETARMTYESTATHKNDYMFVFTDAEEEGMYGAKMLSKFIGYDNAYSRVGFASNFESRGLDGTVIMFQSSANNYNLIKNWSKIRTTEFSTGISDTAYSMMPNFTDFAVIPSGIPALNFANIGTGKGYHTQSDSVPDETVINNHGAMMLSLLDAFGSTDLAQLTAQTDAVYFTYLDAGTIVYSVPVAYVLGALIIVLTAAALIVGKLKKTLNLKAIGKGLGIQLLVLIGSVLFCLASYYLIGLILAACGAVSVHALSTLMFSSIPMLFFAGLFVVAFSLILYHVFRKMFKVGAGDTVRGQIVLWAIVSALISFILPKASLLFAFMGLFESCVLLATSIFKDLYQKKTGESMDKLFLSVLPIVAFAPMIFSFYFLLGDALGACTYYAATAIAVLVSGLIAPYFSTLTKPFAAFIRDKVPAPRVKVVRTVTEPVEDSVKKGKFTMKTYRKTTRERVPVIYRTWHGAAAFMAIALIVVFSLSSGGSFSDNVSGKANKDRAYTDDAIVYVVDKGASAPHGYYWMIGDLDAYKYFSAATPKFDWNGDLGAYVQEDTLNTSKGDDFLPTVTNVSDTDTTKSFNVSTKLDGMEYSLTFANTAKIKEIRIYSYLNNGSYSSQMKFTPNGSDDLTIDGLFGQCSVTVELKTSGTYTTSVKFSGKQIAYAHDDDVGDQSSLLEFEGVWKKVKEYYELDSDIMSRLRAGVQIRDYSLTITG